MIKNKNALNLSNNLYAIIYLRTCKSSVPFVLKNDKTLRLLAPHDRKSAGKSAISMKPGNVSTCSICLDERNSLRHPEVMVGCLNRYSHQ